MRFEIRNVERHATIVSFARMKFELQPTLRGDLLELRPLRPEDYDAVYGAASDPLIWAGHPQPDRYKPEVFQAYWDGALESGGAFAIIERATGRIIGSSRYCNLTDDEVEIGWTFLQREFWGGRYNRELKSLMIDHAVQFRDRIVFVVGETNLRSRRAMEKIGGRIVGTDGGRLVYAVLKAH